MNRRETLKRIAFLCASAASMPIFGCRKIAPKAEIDDLSDHARNVVAQICETILPRTNTPGAMDLEVGRFVIRALNDCGTESERERFIQGLSDFEAGCHARFGRSFVHLSSAQQLSCVEELDRDAFSFWSKIRSRIFHSNHFFKTLKRLCVIGYFSSRDGATKAVAYDPIPGKWIGCLAMKPGQKAWAAP